jgi:hypothetical protein
VLFRSGIFGFILPSGKFGVASFPISSAITSKMFGFVKFTPPESIGVSTGELQLNIKKQKKNKT